VVIGLLLAALYFTGRMDPALSKVGLNWTNCYEQFGTTVCGEKADKQRRKQRQIDRQLERDQRLLERSLEGL
jgi:hypothetical protein